MDALVKVFRGRLRAARVFHKDEKGPHVVMESAKKHMFHLSNQIAFVDQEMNMALLKARHMPRKLDQWLREATDLEREVRDALEEQENSKDPWLKYKELKDVCNKIFSHLKHCPVVDKHDKPMAFVASMHETEDTNSSYLNLLQRKDGLQDEDKEIAYSSDLSVLTYGWTTTNESESESERVPFPDSDGAHIPKLRSESENKLVDETAAAGKSSRVNELGTIFPISERHGELEISREGSIFPSISQVQDENIYKLEIIEEGAAQQGIVEQEDASQRRGETTQNESEGVLFPDCHDEPVPKLRRESERKLVCETVEGENVRRLEIIEEGAAPEGIVEQENASQRRREKMPIGICNPNDVSPYSNEAVFQPELRALESETNQSELPAKTSSSSYSQENNDGECVAGPTQTDESELGTIIPFSVNAEMSMYLKLKLLGILSSSPSQEAAPNLNSNFGLGPNMENYLFSAMREPCEFKLDSHRIYNGGSGSNEMPTADEWHQASVVNLMEKNELSLNEEPACPNLVLLFLQKNNRLTHIPPSFFNKMPALSFLDLSNTRIRELPIPPDTLRNLQVLLLRSCVCLKSLSADVKNLKKLEVLDVLGTDLYHIPKEIGELTQLKHLHLSFYCPDYGSGYGGVLSELIPPGAIFKLLALQSLSIVVHPEDQRWKKIVSDVIQHVGRLEKLIYLQFYFPTVEALKSFIEMSPSWKKKRLRRFKFIVGHNIKRIISRVPDEVESKYDQHDQCLRFVNGSEQVSEVMKSVLKPVTAFYLDHHLEIQSLSDFGISNFNELRFCAVRECPKLQVVTIGEQRSESAFPNLEYLGLHYLWELDRIWEDPVPQGSFKELKYLMVDTCPKIEYIGSRSILQSLSNLETFIIEDCENLKSVVRENEIVKYDAAPLLPRLKELVLRHLPQLVVLGSGLLPSEEIISIHFCPKLILKPGFVRRKFLGSSCNYCNICISDRS